MAKGMWAQSGLVLEPYRLKTVSAGKASEPPKLATDRSYAYHPHIKIICGVFKTVNH